MVRLVPGLSSLYEGSSALPAIDSALDSLAAATNKHQVRKRWI